VPNKDGMRREIKYVARRVQYYHILRWVRLHSHLFVKAYPDRWINNIYYDTYDYNRYEENLSGQSSRHKVRFRWYGELSKIQNGNLEVKLKRNSFGWKQTCHCDISRELEGLEWIEFNKVLVKNMPHKCLGYVLSHPFSALINRYHREYYMSADGNVRITIDIKQSVFDQRYKSIINIADESFVPDSIVMEVKFNRKSYSIASDVLRGVPARASRNSKYMNAINSISGNSNMFP